MEKQHIGIENLPIEILFNILSYTLPENTSSIRLTDKNLKDVITNNFFWENKFKLHFPHLYPQSKLKDNLKWHDEFFSKYISQYKGLPTNIKKLFSIAKEGDIKLLEDYIAQHSAENKWIQDIATVDINGISILEWIRINQQQSLLDCIYKHIIKIDANFLIKINNKIQLSPQSTLWFVLCRQPANKLNSFINVDDAWINGYQTIHFAAENGNIEIIEKLITHGVDITTDCEFRCKNFIQSLRNEGKSNYLGHVDTTTPFEIALKSRQIEVAKFILKHIDTTDKHNNTLLHIAVNYSCTEIIDELVKNKADINTTDNEGRTPLHLAIRRNQSNVIEKLLEHKADINANTSEDGSPFHYAILYSTTNIEILINVKPNIEAITKHGDSILHFAAHNRNINVEILEKLLAVYDEKIRAMVNSVNTQGATPLHIAINSSNYAMVKFLLKIGADVNVSTFTSRKTPLLFAILHQDFEIIDILIANKANIDAVDNNGQTVLHWILKRLADSDSMMELVKKLIIEHKANINIADVQGITPLHIAVEENSLFFVKILLENNAKINSNQNSNINLEQKLFLHTVIEKLNIEILSLLLEYNKQIATNDNEPAYVDSTDKNGRTALHIAAEKGVTKFVKILLEYNAKVDISDNQGEKPIDIAQRKGYTDIVNLINIQSLYNYLEKLSLRPDSHRNSLFGYTAGDKRKAAKALINVVCDNGNPNCLEPHKKALNDGALKKIYISLLPIIEEVRSTYNTSVEIIKNQR